MKELTLFYLGESGSGKTCAIAGLYEAMQAGILLPDKDQPLPLRLVPEDARGRPIPAGDWARMTQTGRLPPARPGAALYSGTLFREREPLCRLCLLDYPGSALMEKGLLMRTPPKEPADCAKDPPDDQDPEDPYQELDSFFEDDGPGTGALLNLLCKTPVLVYVLPGDLLATDRRLEWMEAHQKTGTLDYRLAAAQVTESVGLLRSILQRVRALRTDCPPLLLYVTKADRLPTGVTLSWAAKRFIQRRNLFFPDTEVLACGSTLGDEVRPDGSGTISAGLAPRGFALPLLLALGRFLSQISLLDAQDLVKQQEREKAQKDPYSYLVGHIGMALLGVAEARMQALWRSARRKTAAWSAACGIARYLEDCGEEILYFNKEQQLRPLWEFFALEDREN